MDEDNVKIVFRAFDPETDSACVYSTWRNSAFYGSDAKKLYKTKEHRDNWFRGYSQHITACLDQSAPIIACLETDPDTIIGYVVADPGRLHWCYVKPNYRNAGILNKILTFMPNKPILYPKQITAIGKAILTKKGLIDD